MAPEGCQKRNVSLDFVANAVLSKVPKKKEAERRRFQARGGSFRQPRQMHLKE